MNGLELTPFWSAVAERSGDTALDLALVLSKESGVAASLCHRTPKGRFSLPARFIDLLPQQ
jgi:hypothetical protein